MTVFSSYFAPDGLNTKVLQNVKIDLTGMADTGSKVMSASEWRRGVVGRGKEICGASRE